MEQRALPEEMENGFFHHLPALIIASASPGHRLEKTSEAWCRLWERVKNIGQTCCSVAQSCLTLCYSMDCSMPGFPVLPDLLEFSQTHVHWVSDIIQPSCPLSSPSPPAFNLSRIRVFSNESTLHIRWPKYWSFSYHLLKGCPCCGTSFKGNLL